MDRVYSDSELSLLLILEDFLSVTKASGMFSRHFSIVFAGTLCFLVILLLYYLKVDAKQEIGI